MISDIIEVDSSSKSVGGASVPLLSIIMPVYNMERYLEQSVDSILAQSFSDWELILVDDGSTDSSPAICDSYGARDSRIRVIHQENSGQGMARNNALRNARGRYVGFVDSDDWIEADMFGDMVSAIEREHADMAVCGYYLDFIGRCKIKEPVAAAGVYDGCDLMREGYLDRKVQSIACDKIFRREIAEEGFSGQRYFEDHAVMLRWFSRVARWVSIGLPKYHYRMRRSGVTNGFSVEKRMAKFYADLDRAEFMSSLPKEKHGMSETEIAATVIVSAVGTAKAVARNMEDSKEALALIEKITSATAKYSDAASGGVHHKVAKRYGMMKTSPRKFRRRMRFSNMFAFGSHKKQRVMYD